MLATLRCQHCAAIPAFRRSCILFGSVNAALFYAADISDRLVEEAKRVPGLFRDPSTGYTDPDGVPSNSCPNQRSRSVAEAKYLPAFCIVKITDYSKQVPAFVVALLI